LHFPGTILDFSGSVSVPPENEILDAVAAEAVSDGNQSGSRIAILLKQDRPYELYSGNEGLRILFPKTTARQENTDLPPEPGVGATRPEEGPSERVMPTAAYLESVTATPLKDHMIVNVHADGTIFDYQSFAIKDPARIVFDLFSLKSSQAGEAIVPVGSKWVKQMRYFTHADKVRLVLDTDENFLNAYFSFPTASGLLIYIGRAPERVRY
jgi:hypothetical protein